MSISTGLNIAVRSDGDLCLGILVKYANDVVNLVSFTLADVVFVEVEPDVLYEGLEYRFGFRFGSGCNYGFGFRFGFGLCYGHGYRYRCGNGLLAKTDLEAEESLILPVEVWSKVAGLAVELIGEDVASELEAKSYTITKLEVSTQTKAANGSDELVVPAFRERNGMCGLKSYSLCILEAVSGATTNKEIGIEYPVSLIGTKICEIQQEVDTALGIVELVNVISSLAVRQSAFALPAVEVDAGTNRL